MKRTPHFAFFFAPPGKFSSLGVSFASSILSRVRITSGNTALAGGATDQDGNTRDLVVVDDFIFAELTTVVPEPATFGLLASGMIVWRCCGAGARSSGNSWSRGNSVLKE